MTGYSFEDAQREWQKVPNDFDYFDPAEWLALTDDELRGRMLLMEEARYGSWRNYGNRWREILGLDDTTGKVVLDFGCGVGIEALQFARAGNQVIVADINETSVELALRVLNVFGFEGYGESIWGGWPFIGSVVVDVFYANGVLHHTPDAPAILARASELLSDDGEVRLMLYSDRGWRVATHMDPPAGDPTGHPEYWRFVRFFDSVGLYAEPWWEEKLAAAVDGFLEMLAWDYITPDDRYAVARLRRV